MIIQFENSTQVTVLAVSALFATIATVSVGLRFYARRVKHNPVKADDWCILVALILALGLVACDMTGVIIGGVGLHVEQVALTYGPQPLVDFAKTLVAVQILWATSLAMTKASILLFYMRIFDVANSLFRVFARLATVAIMLWCTSVILCSFLLCRPFAFNWDQTIPGGHCGNQILSYVLTGTFNILTDVTVLCLPLPIIWRLQMPLRNKVALTLIFAVGFFICVVSIVRTITLVKISYLDITYSVPVALIWSMLEPTLGITIACIPVMRPLVKGMMSSANRGGSGYNGSGSHYDSRNFQNIEEQRLYPLKDLKQETVIGHMFRDGESLSYMTNDAANYPAFGEVHSAGGINVRKDFRIQNARIS